MPIDIEKLVKYAESITDPLGLRKYSDKLLIISAQYINKICPESKGRGISDAGRLVFIYEGVEYSCIVGQEVIRFNSGATRPKYEYNGVTHEVDFTKRLHPKHLQWVNEKKTDDEDREGKVQPKRAARQVSSRNTDDTVADSDRADDTSKDSKPVKIESAEDLKKFQMEKGNTKKPKPKKKPAMKKSKKKRDSTKSAF